MCGFVGVYYFQALRTPDRELLTAQVDTLVHRGPDGGGVWTAPGIGLGHRRLSIIDIEGGAQPMFDESGRYVVAFNGEIYNYRELRARLIGLGYTFRSESDTEVLLASYAEWGASCVDHCNGMFAFALYDRQEHRLFLGRDRLGLKPLFYYVDGERIVFGSEIKALVRDPSVHRQLEPTAVADFFALAYIPAPKTIFKNMYKLPAGHRAVCNRSRPVIESYWDIDLGHVDTQTSLKENAKVLRGLLEDSVQLRMRSDVPLGAFLSGGLDSSAVVAAMATVGDTRVLTQSVGFQEQAFDERHFARDVAERFGTEHHEQVLSAQASDVVAELGYFYDEPFGDSSAAPTYYLCKETRRHVKVALSGDGGDESFAGYDHYAMAAWTNNIRDRVPRMLRRAASAPLLHLLNVSRYSKRAANLNQIALFSSHDDRDRNAYHHLLPQPYRYRELLSRRFLASLDGYDPFTSIRDLYARSGTRDLVGRMQYCDIKSYLCDDILVKVDRASMANSLEVRCPLLDHRIVELGARIPRDQKMSDRGSKLVLKESVAPWIEPSFFERDKQGFAIPLREWLQGPLSKRFASLVLEQTGGGSGLLSSLGSRRLWMEEQHGLARHGHQLWNALMFEGWHESYASQGSAPPRAGVLAEGISATTSVVCPDEAACP